jgi:hypothetical protein
MYIGWANSTQGYTVISTKGTGHDQPSLKQPQDIQIVQSVLPKPAWANIAFSFSRPVNVEGGAITQSTTYIYAYSSNTPDSPDSVNARFSIHSKYGVVENVDFLSKSSGTTGQRGPGSGGSPALTLPADLSWSKLMTIHGSLMFIAWGVGPFAAIFVARYLKHLGHVWYILHVGIFVVITAGFTIGGFLVVYLYKTPPHYDSTHGVH